MPEPVMVYATFPDEKEAKEIAKLMVESKLAACANVLPSVQSIYRWEGKVEEAEEVVVIFKTVKEFARLLAEEIVRLHSYDVPAVVGLPIIGGNPDYFDWMLAQTLENKD